MKDTDFLEGVNKLIIKEVEIVDGKFTLEGKVVDAEPVNLTILDPYWKGIYHPSQVVVEKSPKGANAYVGGKIIEVKSRETLPPGIIHEETKCFFPVLYLKIKKK